VTRRAAPILAGCCGLVLVGWSLRPMLGDPSEAGIAVTAPRLAVALDTLRRGESLGEVLANNGFTTAEAYAICDAVSDHTRLDALRPGVVFRFVGPPGSPPDRVRLQICRDSLLRLAATDSGWIARVEVEPFVTDTVRISGVIETSLSFARLGGDADRLAPEEFEQIAWDVADVFAWKVDFERDIQPGDGFRLAVAREVRRDGSVRRRSLLAVELDRGGRTLRAAPFTREDGRRAWYDADGRSMRGAFLRSPVPYRVTSGFSGRRFHPVLKRFRAHRGIDYGAPHGARVLATSAGTVVRAGWWGAYGRMIEIRHPGGISTRYAHLSSFARGIRTGVTVGQGECVGRVGSTGMATGPHLHYEFLQHGSHRNPLSVSLPTAPGIDDDRIAEFRAARDDAFALLDHVPPPPGPGELIAVAR
jgi:YD repeat-containing protein